jgi:serine peptidase DegS
MSKLNDLLSFIIRSIAAGLAIAFVVVYLWPAIVDNDEETKPQPLPEPVQSYADAVNRAAPAVVSIDTHVWTPGGIAQSGDREKGFVTLYRIHRDSGSGVILSEDGYILTNHHVIDQTTTIRVELWDGRIIPARIVGSDPATDIAVLKVDLSGLPAAPINEDGEVRVGDVVLAIGNPLRLSHTVTMGIVSATGRNDLMSQQFEDFIQTDAAINRGNSGGALVNARGELIGINSRNTSLEVAQNIGFAIPIDLALDVMEQIIEYGSVRRGWLGAEFSDLRPTVTEDGSFRRVGIVVSDVVRDGPAWVAGLRQGDVILELDGETVDDASRFLLNISQREPGSQVELDVVRDKDAFQTYATLIQQPPL